MRSGSCRFSEVVKDAYGTVYTPISVIDMVLNDVERFYGGSLATATICDPAIGDANFLVALYRRLTSNYTGQYHSEFSLSILSRFYGVEILDCICELARWRLVCEHTQFLLRHKVPATELLIQSARDIVQHNIIHGNSLRTPDDTWMPKPFEGGIIPKWFADTRFDIIVGNPPYLVYVSSKDRANKPVPVKYKTASLAHSFWLWVVEHVRVGGLYSLNIKRSILNSDSKVRQQLIDNVISIHYTPTTREYSMGDGGDVETLVFTGVREQPARQILYYNNQPIDKHTINGYWHRGRLINQLNSKPVPYKYKPVDSLLGELVSGVGGGKDCKRLWNDLLCDIPEASIPTHIAWGHVLLGNKHHQYKLIRLDGTTFKAYASQFAIGTNREGAVKAGVIREHGLLTWLWLNSSSHTALPDGEMFNWGLSLGSTGVVCNNMDFANCRVPDWNLYNDIAPEACAAAVAFAVYHINSKNVNSFDMGVDSVVDSILSTTIPEAHTSTPGEYMDNSVSDTNGDAIKVAPSPPKTGVTRSFYWYKCGCRDFKAKGGLDRINCGYCGQEFVAY